jgi:hypothetical protein
MYPAVARWVTTMTMQNEPASASGEGSSLLPSTFTSLEVRLEVIGP